MVVGYSHYVREEKIGFISNPGIFQALSSLGICRGFFIPLI
jgi:hypothetical protein